MPLTPSLPDMIRQATAPAHGVVEITYDRQTAATICSADRRCPRLAVQQVLRQWLDALAELGVVVESLTTAIALDGLAPRQNGQPPNIDLLHQHLVTARALGADTVCLSLTVRPGQSAHCRQQWLPHAVITSERDDARFLAAILGCDQWFTTHAGQFLGVSGRIDLTLIARHTADENAA